MRESSHSEKGRAFRLISSIVTVKKVWYNQKALPGKEVFQMDFLQTLLVYMAATLTIAVESTSTPSVTPVPTPSPEPTAAAVETVSEIPSLAPTATPTATVSVTPVPVPTITPNRAYRNLKMGDRGAEVKRLQERLIELGYMPEGTADGAYGGQTRTAVRRFQYYNGLTVDGIAGRATQTNLFEISRRNDPCSHGGGDPGGSRNGGSPGYGGAKAHAGAGSDGDSRHGIRPAGADGGSCRGGDDSGSGGKRFSRRRGDGAGLRGKYDPRGKGRAF